MEEEEDDDPVVEEFPVYLSQALANNLYVYQYPVRPSNRDWTNVNVTNAAIRPKNQMVRLEVGLDVYSDKYNGSKGEQIAINTDGMQDTMFVKEKDRDKTPYFQNNVMDKIVYESSAPSIDPEQYAVAILQDKEMHITPIQGIVQLRPSYSYFDKQDKRKTDKNKTDNEDEEEKELEAQQVTVKFAKQETEVAKKAREKSYETLSKKIKEEPWYDALWKPADSDYGELERLKLFSATTSEGSSVDVAPQDYLAPMMNKPNPDQPAPSLVDQIKQILGSAKLMTLPEIRAHLGETEPLDSLLASLGAAACCVRGLWTLRSTEMPVKANKVPQRLLAAARDHVLYLFTQHTFVDRRKVAAAVRLPPEDVLDILESVAEYRPDHGWQLLLPPDTAFEAKYPDIVQRQNLYWEARQRQFNDMLIGESVPKRQRKKSQRDSVSSDTMMSPKARCNSFSEDDSVKRQKNKGVGKRTRNISSSSVQDST